MDLPASARDAYIFAYRLVMNYGTMYMPAIAGDRSSVMDTSGLASPDNFDIVTPNNDTPYFYASLDLRAGPWV